MAIHLTRTSFPTHSEWKAVRSFASVRRGGSDPPRKIDKTLFVYSMKASGRQLPEDAEVLLQMTG